VVCQTDGEEVEESVAKILTVLEGRGYVDTDPDAHSPEEEAEIASRLRSLGYL